MLVRVGGRWVSLDARLPPVLFVEALREGRLAEFLLPASAHREVRAHHCRLDVRLEGPTGRCWVQTKSVTLVEERTALFPDAVTVRGRHHVEVLQHMVARGERAALVFVVQRDDAIDFRPHERSDPAFCRAVRQAAAAGVGVYAYTCRVTEAHIAIAGAIPVLL
ncbi:MAG: DNA/RNA nuclease SfsA [Ardenticatenia bacterium]|nr:DNA/RNA nuclease SfsA [Ardenticatenia bacterium]